MRLAVLFSGQGNQQPEHLARLQQTLPAEMQALLAQAIPEVWHDKAPSPADIQANRVAQPLIFALQMDIWRKLSGELPKPVCVAGYSLGEMAACCAAGLFPADQGIALCVARAEAMDRCLSEPAGLLAIKGLGESSIASLAESTGLVIAIRNGPDHFVLGGLAAGLASAESMALAQGANRVIRLGVTIPSHTPFLRAASVQLAERLDAFRRGRLAFPVMSAIDGRSARQGEQSVDALARQVSSPLDWEACLDAVLEMQPDLVLEIGPGNALARMWEERNTRIPVRAADDFRSVDGMLRWIQSHV